MHANFIRWQCRRGMLELDTLLLSFFERCYSTLSAEAQRDFARLLQSSDQDLFGWLMGYTAPDDKALLDTVKKIQAGRKD